MHEWLKIMLDALKALFSLLAGLVTMEALGPHVAVLLIMAGESVLAWWVMPRQPKVNGVAVEREDILADYRDRRKDLFRRRYRRLVIYMLLLFVAVVFSNAYDAYLAGVRVDHVVSFGVSSALVFQAIRTAEKAEAIFESILERVQHVLRPHQPRSDEV